MLSVKSEQRFLKLALIFFMILFVISCGGGGGGDGNSNPTNTPATNDNISGTWKGTSNTLAFGEAQTTFNFSQEGNNIDGNLQWSDTGGTANTDDVSGTIYSSVVTISAIFYTATGSKVEFGYEGSLSDNICSGSIKLFVDDQDTGAGGTFSLSKYENASTGPPSETQPSQQCLNDYSVCAYYCGSNTSCNLDCISGYNNCLETGETNDDGNVDANGSLCRGGCVSSWVSCEGACRFGAGDLGEDEEGAINRQKCYNECAELRNTCEERCN